MFCQENAINISMSWTEITAHQAPLLPRLAPAVAGSKLTGPAAVDTEVSVHQVKKRKSIGSIAL